MAFCFIALSLWSCKKDETQTVAIPGAEGTLKSSVSTVVLDKTMLTTNVITFNVSEGSFGYNGAVSNVLQVALKGTNFATVKEALLDVRPTTKSFTGLELNNLLLGLNLPTTSNSDVEFRVKSTISASFTPVYSNVVSLSARPFPLTSWIYVPGNYQGWNPATADSLVSVMGNGVYTGVIKFDGGNFKITTGKNWDVAYGSAGEDKISTTGGDISSVSAGMKQVTVDLNNNTIVIADAKVWSLIGAATPGGWDSDTDLKVVNDGTNSLWKATTTFSAGEYKFRFGHDWGTSLGGNITNLVLNGGNISMATPGTYAVTLTLSYDGTDTPKVTGGTFTLATN